MPVYKISKMDRCKVLNVSESVYDRASALRAARRKQYPPTIDPKTGETMHDPRHYLSWYDACRLIDPKTDHRKYHFIVDNGHHDHGEFHTITVSANVAKLLTERLGVELTFHHALHHVPPETEPK